MTEQKNKKGIVIFVVGMHRSGTSAITRTINLMGAEVGSRLIENQGEINVDGFWEHQSVVDINEHILRAANSQWYDTQPISGKWKNKAAIKREIEKVFKEELIEDFLVIKDPRLCLTLPIWLESAESAGYNSKIIFVYRHPVSVVKSISARDPFSEIVNEHLWLKYNFEALSLTNEANFLAINYDKFVERPLIYVEKIKKYIPGAPWKEEGVDAAVDSLVSINKRRQNLFDLNEVSETNRELIRNVYECLKNFEDETNENLFAEIKKLAKQYKESINENILYHQALFETNNNLIKYAVQLHELGNEYSDAQNIVRKREETILEQGRYLETAESLIVERDEAIKFFEAELLKNNKLLKNAENVVLEREACIKKQGELVGQAEALVKERDERIEVLSSKLKKEQEWVEKLESSLIEKEAQVNQKHALLENAEKLIAEHGESQKVHEEKLDQAQKKIDELAVELSHAETELNLIKGELDKNTSLYLHAKNVVAEREVEIKRQGEYLIRAESLVRERDEAIVFYQEELNKNLDLLKSAEKVVAEREETIRQQGSYYLQMESGFKSELEALQQRLSVIEAEHKRQLEQSENQMQTIVRLEQEIDIKEKELAQYCLSLRIKDVQLKQINDELLEWSTAKKLNDVKMRLACANKKLANLEREKMQLDRKLANNIKEKF